MREPSLPRRLGPASAIALLAVAIAASGAEPTPKAGAAATPEAASSPAPPPDAAPPGPASSPAAGTPGWFGTERPLIVPPFEDQFPGIDLKALTPPERERFLHRANTEPCTCGQSGCDRHTLAFCLTVDPGCPRVHGSLRRIVADILAARPKPASSAAAPAPPPAPAR